MLGKECSSKEQPVQESRDARDCKVFKELKPASKVLRRESRAGEVSWGHARKPREPERKMCTLFQKELEP